jgi:aminopeptidase N
VALLRRWIATQGGENGSTEEFIALAERVSGRQLDDLFNTWVYTAGKPPSSAVTGGAAKAASLSGMERKRAAAWLDEMNERLKEQGRH